MSTLNFKCFYLPICLLVPLGATANAGESISHVSEAIWLASAVKENKSSLVVNSIGIVNIPYSYSLNPNSTAKCDTRQYQAANTISLKTIAGCLKSKHFFGR